MKKTLIGVILGTVVYFIWGALAWTVLPYHDKTMKPLPEEQLISDTLKTVVAEPGLYFFPNHKSAHGGTADRAAWEERFKKGPVGMLIYSPEGKSPMDGTMFVWSVVGDLIVAGFVFLILISCRSIVQGFFLRVVFCAGLGVMVWTASFVPLWNWFNYPAAHILGYLIDFIVGFALIGAVQAKFIPEAR